VENRNEHNGIKTQSEMEKKVSNTNHEAAKQQIVAAAAEIFGKHGFKKTNIEDIAKACRRGQSSFYYYFKNKEDVFRAVIEKEFNTLMSDLRETISSTSDPQQKLRLYLSSRMHKIKSVSNFYDTLKNDFFDSIPFVEEMRKDYDRQEFQLISSILDEGKSRNIFHIENTENVTQAIMSAMRGLEIPFFIKQIVIDIDNRIDELLNILFYGLLKR
jgi:AcrR family transcriptional regulator